MVAAGAPRAVAFNPAIIAIIIQVIILLVENCDLFSNASEVSRIAKNPNMFQRFVVRHYVKFACGDSREERQFYRKYGNQMVLGVFDVGANATVEDIEGVIQDVKNENG